MRNFWPDDSNNLNKCIKCGQTICFECFGKTKKCARCVKYDLSNQIEVVYRYTENPDVEISCAVWSGIGVHYWLTIQTCTGEIDDYYQKQCNTPKEAVVETKKYLSDKNNYKILFRSNWFRNKFSKELSNIKWIERK